MSPKQPVKREYSAGGVVFKRVKVLWFITQPSAEGEPWRQGRWQLPKGWIDEKKRKVFKNVVFFLMEYESGSEKDHGGEVKEAVWLPFKEAHERLTFKSEKEILTKGKKIFEKKGEQSKLL